MNAGAVITNETEKIKCGIFGAQADFTFLDSTYTMSVLFLKTITDIPGSNSLSGIEIISFCA